MIMKRSKKSQMLGVIIIVGIFIAIITFASMVMVSSTVKPDQEYIGQNQLAIIQTATKAEKALLFIDQAAKLSAKQAVYELADQGGVPLKQCGEYYGYNSWYSIATGPTEEGEQFTGVQKCYPESADGGLNIIMNTLMSSYHQKFLQTVSDFSPKMDLSYNIEVKEQNPVKILGKAQGSMDLPIVIEKKGTEVSGAAGPSGTSSGTGTDCHYCRDAREYVKEMFGEDAYKKCKGNGKLCCQEKCPSDSVLVPKLAEYSNQNTDFRDLGACSEIGSTISSSGCGPVSMHMAFEESGIDVPVESLFCKGGENLIYPGEAGGSNFNKMGDIAKKFVPSSIVYWKFDFDKISNEINQGHPVVLDIKQKDVPRKNNINDRCFETSGHYVNVVGASEKYLIVNDPSTGLACASNREFGEKQVWSKEFVNDVGYYGIAMVK